MPASNFPNGFAEGVTIRGVPLIQTHPGKVFWVSNSTTGLLPGQKGGSNGNKGTFDAPFSTIDYAIGQCAANRGDIIFVKANHAETITAASGITCDVAGVAIVGLGSGTDRPELTFGTATTASVVVSAANVSIIGMACIGNIDALSGPFDIQASDCYLDIEWRDASSTVEAARAVLGNASADRLTIRMKYRGQTGGDAGVNAIRLVGSDGADIEIDFYGKASTSVVEFLTTACTNVNVRGYMYNSGTTDGSKNVVDTATGSTWYSDIVDGAAGARYTGGSAAAVASDDITAVTNALYGSAGIATYPAAAAAANGVSISEVIRYIEDALVGTAGVVTFPSAAAPANGVSLAEVIRSIYDRQLGDGTNAATNSLLGKRIDRTTADVITGAAVPIYTVAGGRVLVTSLSGKVTTIIGAGATNAKFQFNPTTGTTNDICANLDIDADEAGTLYSISGVASDAMLRSESGAIRNMSANGLILDVGDIEFITAADRTGSISFQLFYIPLDNGATIVAA